MILLDQVVGNRYTHNTVLPEIGGQQNQAKKISSKLFSWNSIEFSEKKIQEQR